MQKGPFISVHSYTMEGLTERAFSTTVLFSISSIITKECNRTLVGLCTLLTIAIFFFFSPVHSRAPKFIRPSKHVFSPSEQYTAFIPYRLYGRRYLRIIEDLTIRQVSTLRKGKCSDSQSCLC